MPKSMTGYGSAFGMFENTPLMAEVKSVNARYLETSVRIPRMMSFAEDSIRRAVQKVAARGKVDVTVNFEFGKANDAAIVEVNRGVVAAYIDAAERISKEYAIPNDFGTSALSKIPDAFTITKRELEQEAFAAVIAEVLGAALEAFNQARVAEGGRLTADIGIKITELEAAMGFVKARAPESVREYRERLTAKMRDILKDTNIDHARVLTEAALFAEKTDIDEELTRLGSHIDQAREYLELDSGAGRKLDFLAQELNREVNTIGSKCSDLEITRMVLEMKAIIERIREQCQNLE
ncbi:MAG: YicC family protein [Oscillospiraceae bacterium]|jgi:uncharacterized protein (TIGR00255 family)|nr:YicC family protein [Oscillospiraceae bacterium]